MNIEYFIAKRLQLDTTGAAYVSRPAVKVAVLGIAIGLMVMIITVAVVIGFKQEVRNKVIGFGSHIQVVNFDNNTTYEMQPILMDSALQQQIALQKGVRSVQSFATKPGIIKTDSEFQAVILKGVNERFDWEFFRKALVEGELPHIADTAAISTQVLISELTARQLDLKLHDTFFCYFIQEQVSARRFTVSGIYNTDFPDFDRLFVLGDLRQVQRLNGWEPEQVSGLEILIDDFDNLDRVAEAVYELTANQFDAEGNTYLTQTIKEVNTQLFSWLDLLDTNVWVIIGLMLAVAGFNMISGLLIIILDGVQLIGVLKAMGATNWQVRRLFLWQAAFLIGKGMLWGNVVGVALCALQYFFHLIPLDATAYYVDAVPVAFNLFYWLVLNVGTLLVSMLILIAPSYIITRISPAKVMRYE